MEYNFTETEKRWQKYWAENKTFKAETDNSKPKYYVLDMFPYPSGAGLHVGHPLGYIASDIYSRFKRLQGFNVLHPIGYDAFGLPAEQYAIQTGRHPAITTEQNIKRYRQQLSKIGFSFDWDREVKTCDPKYYKWTQWASLEMFRHWYNKKTDKAEPIEDLIAEFEKNGNKDIDAACNEIPEFTADEWRSGSEKKQQEILLNYRLAYLADTMVNWCPELGTVLANDEVTIPESAEDAENISQGIVSKRGGYSVFRKTMKQWCLRITAYAQRLLEGLDNIEWTDSLKEIQRYWIGRSEGAMMKFHLTPALSKGEGGKPRFYNTDAPTWSGLKENVKNNRRNETDAEILIWQYLRNKQTGHKIRRQHAINKFIVDFVCIEKGTIIEIDGKIYDKQKTEDEKRTKVLNAKGFEIIRFKNKEVLNNIEKVISEIKNYLDNKVLPYGEDLGGVITVFTTRPDTIFGCTFMVLAPESELVDMVTTAEFRERVDQYVEKTKKRTERDRIADVKSVSGQFTGAYAEHPFSKEPLPIWISDYVLAGYGTGAIMAVPAHDSRDYAFAKHFNLPIVEVVTGGDITKGSYDAKTGTMVNSDFMNGLDVKDAIKKTIDEIEKQGLGERKVNYRLRDAIFSRQRYWGEPFPIYYKDGMPYPFDDKDLPLELPEVDAYLPTEKGEPPLGRAKDWKTKEGYPIELNTMPGFAGSSAYYIRYMDPHNDKALVSKEANEYWRDVDLYVGGTEHATGHLIYSRFWNKFLFDIGVVCEDEPFKKLINQGMIQGRSNFVYMVKDTNKFVSYNLRKDHQVIPIHVDVNIVENDVLDMEAFKGSNPDYKDVEYILEDGKYICGHAIEKMSKSLHNVVNPDDVIEKYGADTLRMYEMFLGPLEVSKPWDTHGIEGVYRFLRKLWNLFFDRDGNLIITDRQPSGDELKTIHKTIKKVQEDILRFSFNTSVSAFMICVNELTEMKCSKRKILEDLVIILSPFAPHIAEELWERLGHEQSISFASFPEYKEEYLAENTFIYPVSFNGKLRFKLELAVDMANEDIEKAVLSADEAQKWLEGKTLKKIIIVPKKIINVVI